ncbi:hypothetical protein V8C34DRAFT_285491 [Trichoderma compactum]
MAPTKASRRDHDEHKADAPAKEKNGGHGSTKMRRGASQQTHAANRDPHPAPASVPVRVPTEALLPSLPWASFERRSLHAYLREHELTTPSSYSSSFHNWVLSRPGSLGLYSPTMVRKQQIKRQSKDQLALAVRKHFNGLGIQENDVIVDFIYKVRNHQVVKDQGTVKQVIVAAE